MLLRVEEVPGGSSRRLHVMRRSGEVVTVHEEEVVKLKLLPSGTAPFRIPASWEKHA